MRYWKVTCSVLPAAAMALYPFMLFKNDSLKNNEVIIRHEKIHFRQQIELLIIPFYLLYITHYFYNLLRYRDRSKAYLNICFEKEAYIHDQNSTYLQQRPHYAWLKFC